MTATDNENLYLNRRRIIKTRCDFPRKVCLQQTPKSGSLVIINMEEEVRHDLQS